MHDHLPGAARHWSVREPSAEERALLARFIDAHERCDAAETLAIASEDIRITMPPYPHRFEGIPGMTELLGARVRRRARRRLATRADDGEPAARRRELPAPNRRHRVPAVQARRAAHRRRQGRRDHDVRGSQIDAFDLPPLLA